MQDVETLWKEGLSLLSLEIDPLSFSTYINPLILSVEDNEYLIYAHNPFVAKYVRETFMGAINSTLSHLLDREVLARIVVGKPQVVEMPSNDWGEQVDFSQLFPTRGVHTAQVRFDPLFTFDNFVQGNSNRYAKMSAQSTVEHLGERANNPLVIFGKTGLGKTHLMHAIGSQVLQKHPHYKISMIQSERFMRDMGIAISKKEMEAFKEKYRNLDLLMIDDIHTMSSHAATQQEFLNTFNSLVDDGKQVVIVGNAFPDRMENLSQPMQSRLKSGLCVEIEPPDLATRKDILQAKLEQRKGDWAIELSDAMAEFIATRIYGSVRDLEGAINTLQMHMKFIHEHLVTEDNIVNALKDRFISHNHIFTVGNIQKIVAEYFMLSVDDLKSKRRLKHIVNARSIAMMLIREKMGETTTAIGEAFGGKDHTSVLHALKRVEKLRQEDRRFNEDYLKLEQKLTP